MSERVDIHEVGPRDGLQNESTQISTEDKISLVDMLSVSGLRRIEVTSFVSPRWVPQLADAAEVIAGISRKPGVRYGVLTPNLKGYEKARDSGASEVAIFAAASETFSRKNINCAIDESFERFAPLVAAATADGIPVRGYVSCVTDCPYEGEIEPIAVASVVDRLLATGCYEVSLGETIGKGTSERVAEMLHEVLKSSEPGQLAGHFHDTDGRALQNIEVSLKYGIRVFDSSAGGLGGCPYAPGAAGNVSTESVVGRLAELGYETGIDREKLSIAARFAKGLRGRNHV